MLESVLRRSADRNASSIDPNAAETEVSMALYSGVSSFEAPEFLGMGPDDIDDGAFVPAHRSTSRSTLISDSVATAVRQPTHISATK